MTGGGGNAPPPPECNGGEFLLSLIQKPGQQQTPRQLLPSESTPIIPQTLHQQPLVIDPAVAAVGPSIAFPPSPWPSNGYDLPAPLVHPPWSHPLSPPFPPGFLGFPQFPGNHLLPNQFPGNQRLLSEDLHKLGFHGNANHAIHNLVQYKQQEQPKLLFGFLPNNSVPSHDGLLNGSLPEHSKFNSVKDLEHEVRSRQFMNSNSSPNSSQHWNYDSSEQEKGGGISGGGGRRGKLQQSGHFKSTPPPGFSNKQRGGGHWEFGSNDDNSRRRGLDRNVGRARGDMSELSNKSFQIDIEEERLRRLHIVDGNEVALRGQLDHPGPRAGSNLHSVSASDVEDSMLELHGEVLEEADGEDYERGQRLRREGEELVDSLLLEGETDGRDEKKRHRNFREKECRVDSRGQYLLSQRLRNLKRHMVCRRDIDSLNARFLSIYESLIPPEEEKAKQKQLLKLLEKLVHAEWPEARLFIYGSCANSFGVSKSDIDVCFAIKDIGTNKSEILLKLAEILKSDNLQNVQALTRARVPIVKLMDPVTELSCDICINNILAVVNTKLLRDYAQIDSRLRQLAFIVKHWAKSRGVNETYQGTLSSYAYVLMCIHFLQQRKPAILPCLQAMEITYSVTVEDVECAFFDQVEKLQNFGSHNEENIAQLVWGFFNYWAYCHDYANSVISVRTGSIISKREKDWTRRIGNDRHLICIEDPFETSHDLGRVVDKFSIKVLREEFERAAEIMQSNPNPCVALFEPYIPS